MSNGGDPRGRRTQPTGDPSRDGSIRSVPTRILTIVVSEGAPLPGSRQWRIRRPSSIIPGWEVIIVRKNAIAIMFAVILGLVVCSSCSSPNQTAENTPKPGADRAREQKRSTPPSAWSTNPEITAEMNLTKEQATQIEAVTAEARTQLNQRAELERRATTRFHRVLSQEKPNPEQVDRMSAELEEVLSARNRIRINRMRGMREVLTHEQWEKLWQLAPAALQVGHVKVFRGASLYVTDGTPVPDAGETAQAEPES